ncbi:MAG: 4-(cytidine 5'-diphospho)-2-C-methyl-D-erythritol kinase [Nitrospiraceae bacterium]|nr:4-(cytidine 5'-diphospho)-2-C-methyl-D-erythritol kinase [Nitrospiraceae bacterium]
MFTLKAPAKINWVLSVLNKRDDGYHNIQSLMQSVSLYDRLAFDFDDTLQVETNADINIEENLVFKAAALFRQMFSIKQGASIKLEKEIPIAAGLGGGSSDAACTLIGLNRLYRIDAPTEDLEKIGAMLGSDIPFFFRGPFALIEGRGEIVTKLDPCTKNVLLLVKPDLRVSAKWAYTEFSRFDSKPSRKQKPELTKKSNNIKLFCQTLEKQDFNAIADMLTNDLEIPVVGEFHAVAEIKDKLLEAGAVASLMSGSGPTVFGLFKDRETADKASEMMRPNWCKIVDTLTEVDS